MVAVPIFFKDYRGAVADFTKAIDLRPEFGLAFIFRGHAYLSLYQKDRAMADFMTAIELGESVPPDILDLAVQVDLQSEG